VLRIFTARRGEEQTHQETILTSDENSHLLSISSNKDITFHGAECRKSSPHPIEISLKIGILGAC